MNSIQVAIYARVSCEQQVSTNTIDSQITALLEQVKADGYTCSKHLQFKDNGFSGSNLIRPALEQLRDAVALGDIDRLYVHSPDRLARKYAYQVVLVDEFSKAGVDVIFLNHPLGQSPEDELLLQVQGMVAEYERAKILERSRRGKRHASFFRILWSEVLNPFSQLRSVGYRVHDALNLGHHGNHQSRTQNHLSSLSV